jgi:hypothetical protein
MFHTAKTSALLHHQRKTVNMETSKELAEDCNRPQCLLLGMIWMKWNDDDIYHQNPLYLTSPMWHIYFSLAIFLCLSLLIFSVFILCQDYSLPWSDAVEFHRLVSKLLCRWRQQFFLNVMSCTTVYVIISQNNFDTNCYENLTSHLQFMVLSESMT